MKLSKFIKQMQKELAKNGDAEVKVLIDREQFPPGDDCYLGKPMFSHEKEWYNPITGEDETKPTYFIEVN